MELRVELLKSTEYVVLSEESRLSVNSSAGALSHSLKVIGRMS